MFNIGRKGRRSIQLSHRHILGYSTDSTKVAKPIRHPILPDPWSNLDQLERYPDPLRRIHYFDAEKDLRLIFLTTNFLLPAVTIAQL